jgi:TonB family protein
MNHGSTGYFVECLRFERRLSAITCALAALFLAPLLLSYAPMFRERAERMRENLRFGVAGDQARYVRRIRIEAAPGPDAPLRDLGKVRSQVSRKGGNPEPRAKTDDEKAKPEFRPRIEGTGESFENLLARALARRSDIPVVPPDQLVIEKLVRPVYPEDARERNIEGKVSVLALVDTLGTVVDVDVVGGNHDSLVKAAIAAVWQCRFQPYRVQGEAREVYVVMPFNFTIY